MATLDEAVALAVAELVGTSDEAYGIYNCAEWSEQRERYQDLKDWYDGTEWQRTIPNERDPVTNELAKQWPLQLNPIAKVCRTHRAVMLGMLADTVHQPPVATTVTRASLSDEDRIRAVKFETFINSVWKRSNAHSILYEAMLLEQVYGGHVMRVSWEPWNTSLPHRLAVRSLKSPAWFYAKEVNPLDDWDLFEAYIGFLIPADVARRNYGITSDKKEVLYLEQWTKDAWRYTVDGQVPVRRYDGENIRLEGVNTWGEIPIVYIPHERDGGYLGRSVVDGNSTLIGLSKELNARLADKGDILRNSRSIPWIKNSRSTGTMGARRARIGGRPFELLDLGVASTLPGAAEPETGILEPKGLPETTAGFTDEVEHWIHQQGDIAKPAVGDDDVSGGRITGPVTAYRMWPTMQHTMAERVFFSDGMTQIARLLLTIALDKQSDTNSGYAAFQVPSPGLDEGMKNLELGTSWRPMIPIEESKEAEMLNEQLAAGGISLLTYLEKRGIQDPEEEANRIWEDRERLQQIEAEAAAQAYQLQMQQREQNQGSNNNGE